MAFNLTQTLINSHLVSGNMQPDGEIALRIDQALLQDVLGTLVMLELEAIGVESVRIDRAAQYVDHNLLETDNLNGDEHLFLRSACRRFGIWYSRPGSQMHDAKTLDAGLPSASLAVWSISAQGDGLATQPQTTRASSRRLQQPLRVPIRPANCRLVWPAPPLSERSQRVPGGIDRTP
jgi:hypothetical protein